MHDTPAFLEIAERLAAAALSQDEWQPALQRLATFLDAGHVIVSARETRAPAAPLVVAAGVDERDLAQSIAAREASTLPPMPSGVPIVRSRLIGDTEYEATAFHNEVIRPINGWHGLFVGTKRSSHAFELAVCRPRKAEDFGAREIEAFRLLLPHVAVSLDLHYRLAAERERSAASSPWSIASTTGLSSSTPPGPSSWSTGGPNGFSTRRTA